MKKKTAILFLIGIVLILLLFSTVNLKKIERIVNRIPLLEFIFYIFLLLIIQITTMLLSAVKWRIVLRNSNVSIKKMIPATFVGYLVNNITPIGLAGGEPVRAYILYKTDNVDMPTSASSVIVDLFLEIFSLCFMIIVSMFIVISSNVPAEISLVLMFIILILIILFIISISMVYSKKYSRRFIRIVSKILSKLPILKRYSYKLRENVDEIVNRFNDAMRLQMMDTQICIKGIFVSLIIWFLRISRLYFSFMAIGAGISISTAFVVETLVSAVSFLPVLPGALGIWECTSVELLGIISSCTMGVAISRESAAVGTIINRIFFYIIPSIIGILSAFYLGLNIKRITENAEFKKLNIT